MLVKGIKKGKAIELLEEVNLPDNQAVLVEIQKVSNFWTSYQNFRTQLEKEEIVFNDDDFINLRDNSTGREINL